MNKQDVARAVRNMDTFELQKFYLLSLDLFLVGAVQGQTGKKFNFLIKKKPQPSFHPIKLKP